MKYDIINYKEYLNSIELEILTEVRDIKDFDINDEDDACIIYIDFKRNGNYCGIPLLVNDRMYLVSQLVMYGESLGAINEYRPDDCHDVDPSYDGDVEILECELFNKNSLEDMIKKKFGLDKFTIN